MRLNEKSTGKIAISVTEDKVEDVGFYKKKLQKQSSVINQKNILIDELGTENKNLKAKLKWFEEQIQLAKAIKYGKSSEQSESLQFDMFSDNESEIQEQEETDAPADAITPERKKKSTGRKLDTSKLPREVVVHDLSETEKCCADCQNELHKIGENVSEKIEIVPAQVKVIEHHTIQYACRSCETAKSAKKEPSLVPKSMAGNSLIIEVILAKYQRHLPLYRQSQIFKSGGVDIPRNTLGNWLLSAFDVLAPIGEALWEQLKQTHVLQVDETPVKMLAEDKKGYMWVYHSCDQDNRFVVFEYNSSRGAHVVDNRLKSFSGILQSDGYSGYNTQRARSNIINVGCFAHCRRKFAEVVKASTGKTGKAHNAIAMIGKLYRIEQEAKDLSHEQRYELRQAKATPIVDGFYTWLEKIAPKTPPQSKIGKAVSYALNQWRYLSEYVHHGEVAIDNNQVENQIRPFALGRKNWLFVGNQRGADAAALFYSLIETCKLNDIEPRKYLTKLFEDLPKVRRGEIDAKALLPQHIVFSD